MQVEVRAGSTLTVDSKEGSLLKHRVLVLAVLDEGNLRVSRLDSLIADPSLASVNEDLLVYDDGREYPIVAVNMASRDDRIEGVLLFNELYEQVSEAPQPDLPSSDEKPPAHFVAVMMAIQEGLPADKQVRLAAKATGLELNNEQLLALSSLIVGPEALFLSRLFAGLRI